jgi:hypothetical protein
VFYDEMKESLTILSELPAVEVTDDFDEEVWRRIREVSTPRSVRALIRMRAAEYWSRIGAFPGVVRWSPVGVAAAVLLMVAIASEPVQETGSVETLVGAEPPATETGLLAAAEEAPVVPARGEESPAGLRDSSPNEVFAGMPEAVEVFLESARELRLEGDTDRFRRSKYSYPLRRVHTPSSVGRSVSSTPVSAGEPEVTVISF